MSKRVLEQHIAVFGESGSGKTVLLSAFYGLMREGSVQKQTKLDVVADDAGQSDRLMQNYLGMSRKSEVPATNRFISTKYTFTARLEHHADQKDKINFDRVKLVWHDYPGEWFHSSPQGEEEASQREATFRALLQSDVALILIDGQQIAETRGHEGDYLKLLFTNIRNGLLPLIETLNEEDERLARFPRVWMFALSKSDLLPEISASELKSLVVLHAAHEVDQLRRTLERVVLDSDATSIGEDFVTLSAAKFSDSQIDVSQRVGLELIIPIATVLPLRRFARWARDRHLRGKVAEALLGKATAVAGVAATLIGNVGFLGKLPGPLRVIPTLLAAVISKEAIDEVMKLAGDKLQAANRDAAARGEDLRTALTQFAIDLETAERNDVLLRSNR